MEKPLVYLTFDFDHRKYYIGYTKNTKDKIHNPVHNGRTYKGSGMAEESIKFNDLPEERWVQLKTQVLAYFEHKEDAHIAESQLQKYLDCAGDENSWNRSNAVNVPSKSIFTKIIKKISSTWFGLGESTEEVVTNDNKFTEDELRRIQSYIRDFDYIEPIIPFNTIDKNNDEGTEQPKEETMNLNDFISTAVRESHADGKRKGYDNPSQTALDEHFKSLTIKLNAQLDARLFTLQESVVEMETKCELFVNNIGKIMQIKIDLNKKSHEIKTIESTEQREKWSGAISNAFEEGFRDGANERLTEL